MPEKTPRALEILEIQVPDVFEYIKENRLLGCWVESDVLLYDADLLWMIEQGFAMVVVSYEQDSEDWGVEMFLWSFSDREHLHPMQLRMSDYIMLNNVIEYAMDVN